MYRCARVYVVKRTVNATAKLDVGNKCTAVDGLKGWGEKEDEI